MNVLAGLLVGAEVLVAACWVPSRLADLSLIASEGVDLVGESVRG
jgi:hypothetical protein